MLRRRNTGHFSGKQNGLSDFPDGCFIGIGITASRYVMGGDISKGEEGVQVHHAEMGELPAPAGVSKQINSFSPHDISWIAARSDSRDIMWDIA